MVWVVVYHPEAQKERDGLPPKERVALYNAVTKLEAVGPALGYLHTSAVQGPATSGNSVPGRGEARGGACTGWLAKGS